MGPKEIKHICEVLQYTKRDLAFALNTDLETICQWENGKEPTGIHKTILEAYHRIALDLEGKPRQAYIAGHLMRNGVKKEKIK